MLSPVTKPSRIIPALGATLALALGLSACGGESNAVPSNAVASVDGTPITREALRQRIELSARSTAFGGDPVIPDPPDYTRCISALRRQQKAANRRARPRESQLRAQCRQLDDQLTRTSLAYLIQVEWIKGEAEEMDITVSDSEVKRALEEQKRQSFRREADYRRFLRQSGLTEEDLLAQFRVNQLATKITEKVRRDAGSVTAAEITDYYNRNREQFAVPERRDLQIVLTRTEAEAADAKRAIEGGMSWADAARRWSTDELSKSNGGRLVGVARGQQDRALDVAAFNAQKGTIVGPVRGQFGWYIVRVTRVTPAKQNSLAESREQIRQQLTQEKENRALADFTRSFQERWTELTNCRRGFIIDYCANAPRPDTTSTAGGTIATTED